mgnify:FL=1
MATPTYTTSTEQDAVNAILMSVGESPVNTLDTQSPEVAIAQATLRQVVREVQAEGWSFNSQYEVEYSPNTDDEILLNENVIQIDLSRYKHNDNYDVIRRRTDSGEIKLYDRYTNSYKFTDNDVYYCDVITMWAFEDLPQPFKDYCTTKATRIAVQRMIGEPSLAQSLQQDEVISRSAVIEYDTRQSDYNVFNNTRNRIPYNPYKPYQVLAR